MFTAIFTLYPDNWAVANSARQRRLKTEQKESDNWAYTDQGDSNTTPN